MSLLIESEVANHIKSQ